MKKILKILVVLMIIWSINIPVYAINVGTYKTETEYGLLDGFKINWKRKDKTTPFIEPREESTKQQYEKEYQEYKDSEYERTKFMYEGKSIL